MILNEVKKSSHSKYKEKLCTYIIISPCSIFRNTIFLYNSKKIRKHNQYYPTIQSCHKEKMKEYVVKGASQHISASPTIWTLPF